MRILVALGGNALLKRSEPLTIPNQIANTRRAASQIAKLAAGNQLVVAHGNGPQVGMLALQSAAGGNASATPLDVLDAESEGMIGYLLEQELANALPRVVSLAARSKPFIDLDQTMKDKRLDYLMIFRQCPRAGIVRCTTPRAASLRPARGTTALRPDAAGRFSPNHRDRQAYARRAARGDSHAR